MLPTPPIVQKYIELFCVYVSLALYWTGPHGSPCWYSFGVVHYEPQEVIICFFFVLFCFVFFVLFCFLSSQLWECRLILKQPPSLELICQDLHCPSLPLNYSGRSQTQVYSPSKGIYIKFFILKPFFLARKEREASLYLTSLMEIVLNSTNLFKEIPLKVPPYWSSTTWHFTLSLWMRGSKLIQLCFGVTFELLQ